VTYKSSVSSPTLMRKSTTQRKKSTLMLKTRQRRKEIQVPPFRRFTPKKVYTERQLAKIYLAPYVESGQSSNTFIEPKILITYEKAQSIWKEMFTGATSQIRVEEIAMRQMRDEFIHMTFQSCDLDGKGKLDFYEFKLGVFTLSLYSKIVFLNRPLIDSILPRNRAVWKLFKRTIYELFDIDRDIEILNKFWSNGFPLISVPDLESEEWKQFGFQDSPQFEFEEIRRITFQCMEALSQHTAFMKNLQTQAKGRGISLVNVCVEIVEIILELMSLGYKNPGIPKGQNPITFTILCKLLFVSTETNQEPQEGLKYTMDGFYKIFLFTCAIMSKLLADPKRDYTQILDITTQQTEGLLIGLKERNLLETYLKEVVGLDIQTE